MSNGCNSNAKSIKYFMKICIQGWKYGMIFWEVKVLDNLNHSSLSSQLHSTRPFQVDFKVAYPIVSGTTTYWLIIQKKRKYK